MTLNDLDWHIAVTGSVAAVVTNVYRFFVRDSLMMYLCKCLVFLFLPTLCVFFTWVIVKIFTHTHAMMPRTVFAG